MTANARRKIKKPLIKRNCVTINYWLMIRKKNSKARSGNAQKLMPEILKIVRAIAEKEKYTLVIDVASMPVPYYAKENDFSKKVIEEYNKQIIGNLLRWK